MLEEYIFKNNKKMRYGYTTGSCAAAAAKAATEGLLGGIFSDKVELMTPKGILLHLPVGDYVKNEQYVQCSVVKDGGDDPDVTNGIHIVVKVEYLSDVQMAEGIIFSEIDLRSAENDGRIVIDGGIGVGRVTKPGLEQPVGAAAINRVPRQMMAKEVLAVCRKYAYGGRLKVTVSVPEGEKIAEKTFNLRLGIKGGISILGTSGIVEPMSETALIESIHVEMKMAAAQNRNYLVVVPGNYGTDFSKESLGIQLDHAVKCSNYVGEMIDFAVELGFERLLFIGHIGKLVKVAGGVMNTHSRHADCRLEIITAHAAMHGADNQVLREIMKAPTTDEGVAVLKRAGILKPVMDDLMEKIVFYLDKRAYQRLEIGVIMFSNVYGVLGKSENADKLVKLVKCASGCGG